MRHPTKFDANHGAIKQAFLDLGCWVHDLAGVGGGCPDLLVWASQYALVEIKNKEGRNRYTPAQIEFNDSCPGLRATVRDLEGVQTLVKAMRGA